MAISEASIEPQDGGFDESKCCEIEHRAQPDGLGIG